MAARCYTSPDGVIRSFDTSTMPSLPIDVPGFTFRLVRCSGSGIDVSDHLQPFSSQLPVGTTGRTVTIEERMYTDSLTADHRTAIDTAFKQLGPQTRTTLLY